MIDPQFFDDIARRLSATMPPGLKGLQEEAEKNFRAVLQSSLSRLDLVTREEFDVQSALLSRTRAKLEALEHRVAALEKGDK